MAAEAPIWITEAEVCRLMGMADAVAAVETGLRAEAAGEGREMAKTFVRAGDDGYTSLQALGAALAGDSLAGTKTWAQTPSGSAPTLVLFDLDGGALRAVIEASALGRMRTGALGGAAAGCLADPQADEIAVIGSGRQAETQVAAVAATRPLKRLRVWSPTPANRQAFAARMAEALGIVAEACDSPEAALRDAPIVTLMAKSTAPVALSAMLAPGAHINAAGVTISGKCEIDPPVFPRCAVVATDAPSGVRKLSDDFRGYYDDGPGDWDTVRPLSALVAQGAARPAGADLTLFKSMGTGVADLAMASAVLARAAAAGVGLRLPVPARGAIRLK